MKHVIRDKTYLLTSQKEKDITSNLFAHVNLYDGTDGGLQVVPLGLGSVEYLNRMCTARNIHQRGVVKVLLFYQVKSISMLVIETFSSATQLNIIIRNTDSVLL